MIIETKNYLSPLKLKFLLYFAFPFLFLNSCRIEIKKIDSNEATDKTSKPKVFQNLAVVTLDSCRKWNLPVTQFAIEYPNSFNIEYNAESRYYVRLRKYNELGVVEEEITIGKNKNISDTQSALYHLNSLDSTFKNNLKDYKKIFLGNRKFGDKKHFILTSLLNFDELNNAKFNNNYAFASAIVFTPNKNLQGIAISFLTNKKQIVEKENISKEALEIWKTFKFIY